MSKQRQDIGIVVIGRNEGSRLVRCLESLAGFSGVVVYVDSASTDGSAATAQSMGVDVVELDASEPMCASRGRNVGVQYLIKRHPEIRFVQFTDGDCEIREGWLISAAVALKRYTDWAIVCGRLREREPGASIYNRLCDLEWDRPVGEVLACGGIFMARVEAFNQIGGFDQALIAGEEPDLCWRLRKAGWRIHRLAQEMAIHDAGMYRFRQWWWRAMRSGYGDGDAAARHGIRFSNRAFKATVSTWVWAAGIPLAVVATLWPTGGWSAVGLLIYPLQVARTAMREARTRVSTADAWLYSTMCMFAKWPQAVGQIQYLLSKVR